MNQVGMQRTTDALDATRVTTDWYDTSAVRYADRWFPVRLERQMSKFVHMLPQGGTVLDLGCGPGRDAAWLEELGFRAVGLDLSAGMLAEARSRTQRLLLADMRRLPFADAVFDGVWFCAALLHVPHAEVPGVLKGIRRISRPPAALFVGVQEGDGEEWRSSEAGRRFFSLWRLEDLVGLVQKAGFSITESFTATPPDRDVTWINVYASTE